MMDVAQGSTLAFEAFGVTATLEFEDATMRSEAVRQLVTKFVAGAVWDPQPLAAAEAALAMLDNTVTVRCEPARAIERICLLCARASGLASERGDAREIAADVITRMGGA